MTKKFASTGRIRIVGRIVKHYEEASTFKATWPFNFLDSIRSNDILKRLYLHFLNVYDDWAWQAAEFMEEFQRENA